ncbi:DinB family protein [Amphibacillus sediminis]|uniref:DinB family protein n=1 Tax=Amphibacillus sediminis TaxID=360185 RepID=UPI000836BBB8|nr:DinB family protein [Amphibacillus sediminis]
MINKPLENEYAAYFSPYVKRVVDQDVEQVLTNQADDLVNLLRPLSEQVWSYQYSPNKWTVREVLGHLIDNEIIMHYRLFRLTRENHLSISGYDQDDFVLAASFDQYQPGELLEYYQHVRQTTLFTIKGITVENELNQAIVEEELVTARALPFIIAGHEKHHLNVLQERYLK